MTYIYQNKNHYGLIGVSLAVIIGVAGYLYYVHIYSRSADVAVNPEVFTIAANFNDNALFDESQSYLEDQIRINPTDELKLYLANSILNEGSVFGKEAEASRNAQEILFALEAEGHTSVYFYDLLGYSYEIVNEFEKAFSYYEKALAIDPLSVNTLFSIGHTHWLKGDSDTARKYYNEAEDNLTDLTDASVRVKVYVAQGRMSTSLESAEQYFLKAIPLTTSKPFKAEIYANMSFIAYVDNDLPKALRYADSAIETDGTNELGYIAFARASLVNPKLTRDEFPKIAAYLMKAVLLAPTKAEAQYWVGRLNFAMGSYVSAVKSYEEVKRIIPLDNSINDSGRNELLSDTLLYESIAYFMNDDSRYMAPLQKSMEFNPVRTLIVLDNNPQLSEMKTKLIESNPLLASIKL